MEPRQFVLWYLGSGAETPVIIASVYDEEDHPHYIKSPSNESYSREHSNYSLKTAPQTMTGSFGMKTRTVFCRLALVLSVSSMVSSQGLNYYVDSLDDTRNAMLSYSSGSSIPGGKRSPCLRRP